MLLKRISVALGEKTYPIYIGPNSIHRLGDLLFKHGLAGIACLVTQREIWSQWGSTIRHALSKRETPFKLYFPNPNLKSEQMKSVKELLKIVEVCSALDGKGRGVYFIALGGGVIGDLTGFAASIYRRGIPYVQVPTTLTAQVDSAIGGKTGVDLPEGKNLLGAIYQPRFVLADPGFLTTLPMEIYKDGLAEVVKSAVISDRGLFTYLERKRNALLGRSLSHLTKVVAACARIKAKVVSRDEFDKKGIRMILNFGHTIGHALEAATGYSRYTHGQAISIGMLCALELSESLSVLKDPSLIRRCEQLLGDLGLPVALDRKVSLKAMMKAMGYDKKSVDGTNRFVLIRRLSKTVIHEAIPGHIILDHIQKRRA